MHCRKLKPYFTIRAAMQAKYPKADFGPYFAFIVSRSALAPSKGQHKHHIAPREQFQELSSNPANLLRLKVSDHKTAHKILAKAVPEMAFGSPQFIAAAEKGARRLKELGRGIHAPGMQAKGGHIGGCKNKALGIGIFAPGMQAKGGRKQAELGLGCHAPGMQSKGGRAPRNMRGL